MEPKPTLEDLIGIEYAKLGFFREVQEKIAELQSSNSELARNQRQIQGILDGITDVMAVLSADLRIVSINQVFHEVFHDPHPEGKYCYQVFRQLETPCPSCPAATAFKTNRVCRQTSICAVGGQNRHFEITASPLRNSEGQPGQVLLLKRDVTLEKEYQAKYFLAERMATIGVLAAGVAHEINNPLTAISGFAEGLKRRLPRLRQQVETDLVEDFNEYVGIILKECQRCQEIVQGLLTFGRQRSADFSAVDLNAVLNDTLKLLHNHLKRYPKDIICLDLGDELPPVTGDASQLKQVILNLLFNALDAVETRGFITIRTYLSNENTVVLAMEDTGCGIPAENLDKLFEPFFTTKPVGKGIGIGLSTCYNIVLSHGGEIVVCSQEGEGSIFHVRLPCEKC
jgi:two-component system, NtrC family, sensor kinase